MKQNYKLYINIMATAKITVKIFNINQLRLYSVVQINNEYIISDLLP